MVWDPQQYGRFAGERSRPFFDLVERIGASAPRRVADLGCGSGELTAQLAQRWPSAQVDGIDSSPEMIAAAPPADRVTYRVGDVSSWTPPDDVEVIVSNATLQWVPSHRELIPLWARALPTGGWIAFQVPGNFDSPSHTLLRSLAESRRWASSLTGILRHGDAVASPTEYAGLLLSAGLTADVWETTYVHVLSGDDPVLQWLRGTALRPVMAALPAASYGQFEAELADQLRQAYPATSAGQTLLPFRRIFAVGARA
ncbi:MAG: trans-aconitate 2-methyltransferase [Jatrophihabitans sp.]|uniref:trans-aconitate 2-methyltransferase n=1 Tax=Jatrophihabitans sp. TaxID=1932789 RepID=UPI00390EFD1E